MPEEFMSVQQLADYLGVKPLVIYGLRYRDEGPPALRVGRALRFRKSDVDAWVETRVET